MKKRPHTIVIVILCIVLLLVCIAFFNFMMVEKVVLETFSHTEGYDSLELNALEKLAVMMLCNLSIYAGEPNAEPCCDSYRFHFYLPDGSEISVGEGAKSKVIVNPISGSRFWVYNEPLIRYIYALVDQYDLTID